jgi:hypothetical protein
MAQHDDLKLFRVRRSDHKRDELQNPLEGNVNDGQEHSFFLRKGRYFTRTELTHPTGSADECWPLLTYLGLWLQSSSSEHLRSSPGFPNPSGLPESAGGLSLEMLAPMYRIVTTGLLVLLVGVPGIRSQSQTSRVSADIEELLWWLPPDTETVEVTQTPTNPRGPLFEAMKLARGEFAGGDTSWAGSLAEHLKGTRINATVDGSRRFAPPSGFGEMLYEGATIIRFAKPLAETGRQLTADLTTRAAKVDQFDGLQMLEFRDKIESDTWRFWITIPRADVLVIATNRAYVEELVRRRGARTGRRAFPEDLPEWQSIDVTAPFWALRHYRRDAPDDSTSPFGPTNMLAGFDTGAIGVTAHVKADGRTIVAHYLSSGATAEQIARRIWHHPGDGVSPEFRRVGGDVVEIRFVAQDEEQLSMFFFHLMAALGHAVYV